MDPSSKPEDPDRRAALVKVAKLGAYTAPAMLLVLSKKVAAQTG